MSEDFHEARIQAEGAAPPETDVQLARRLMRFYDVESLYALIRQQDRHIEKLQQRMPPTVAGQVVGYEACLNSLREG